MLKETVFGPLNEKDKRRIGTFAEALNGSKAARLKIQYEVFSTSDLADTFAKFTTVQTRADLAEVPSTWNLVGKRVTVDDFRPAKETRLEYDTDTNVPGESGGYPNVRGTLARVPEGTEFPTVGFTQSGKAFSTAKTGVRVGWTFEAFINDQWDVFRNFPTEMAKMARYTEEIEVWRQYLGGNGFNANMFKTASNLSGNAPLSYTSLSAALVQASKPPTTGFNNRPLVNTLQKWALIVSPGLEIFAENLLATSELIITDPDGTERKAPNQISKRVQVVSVPYMGIICEAGGTTPLYENTFWALVPLGGENMYGTIANLAFLNGYEEPEIRVKYDQGVSLSGGAIGTFEGSFDNDTTQTRLRHIVKGNTLNNNFGIVWSKGNAAAGQVAP